MLGIPGWSRCAELAARCFVKWCAEGAGRFIFGSRSPETNSMWSATCAGTEYASTEARRQKPNGGTPDEWQYAVMLTPNMNSAMLCGSLALTNSPPNVTWISAPGAVEAIQLRTISARALQSTADDTSSSDQCLPYSEDVGSDTCQKAFSN